MNSSEFSAVENVTKITLHFGGIEIFCLLTKLVPRTYLLIGKYKKKERK